MKVVSVVGARPQFVKLAPIAWCLQRHPTIEHVIVHTGQHYDHDMSDLFFEDLAIPPPRVNLGVGSDTHARQTAEILARIDPVLTAEQPDWVMVYGDTNSTLAATLAAVKRGFRVAHLEAGLRSFNRRMPEEHNRILTDHAADLLLAPTPQAMVNLAREDLAERSVLVGDVTADVCQHTRENVTGRPPCLPDDVAVAPRYVLATLHRAENTDDRRRLRRLVEALQALSLPVVLSAHPRLVARCQEFDVPLEAGAVRLVAPMSYSHLLAAAVHSVGVITDSGGLQKEAFLLGVPCTTLRHETEWVETLQQRWNVLDPEGAGLATLAARKRPRSVPSPFGDGHAAEAVVDRLVASHETLLATAR